MPVRVPVKVRHDGNEHQGLTRDLSSSGIFLYSESGMKAGSKLELVIMLPPGLGLGRGIAATLDRIALLPEIS